MFIDKILGKIKNYRDNPLLILMFFCINILFWYLFFGTKLKYSELVLLAILLTFTLGALIGIFIKIPYRQIPDYYEEWAKTLIRILIFLCMLFLLVYHIYKYLFI